MINILKDNFKTTNNCIILATPMILFFMAVQWYVHTFQYSLNSAAHIITFFITLWILFSGCFAGWFYMVKKTLQFYKRTYLFDTDRVKALSKLFLCLIKGIGKFFISFLAVIALCFCFKIVKILAIIYVFNIEDASVYDFISNTGIVVAIVIMYWAIFWIPEIIYNYVNPFKALINSVKKAYISFKISFPIYLFITLFAFTLRYLLIQSQVSPYLYFILLIISYYFILYSVLLVFRLYERCFVE